MSRSSSGSTKKSRFTSGQAKRFPRYFRYLRSLLINGEMKISSAELAGRLGLSPSQVKSDLLPFNGGQQGYGYNVKQLYTQISRELGVGDNMTAVVIGGEAPLIGLLAKRFEGRGVTVTSAFSDSAADGSGVPTYKISELDAVLEKSPADIAVIIDLPPCLDTELLTRRKIRGIWNMGKTDISSSVPVFNLPIGDIIMSLCYEIRKRDEAECQ